MKILLTAILFISIQSFSQEPLTAKFRIIGSPGWGMTVEVSQRKDQIAGILKTEDSEEYIIIDKQQKKMLGFLKSTGGEETYREAREYKWDEEFSPANQGSMELFVYFASKPIDKQYYRILSDRKTMFGKECRKIEILEDKKVVGSGWIMPGVKLELTEDIGWMRTKEGLVVELRVPYGEYELGFALNSLDFSVSPDKFILELPEGYELYEEPEIIPEPGDEDYVPPLTEDE